jgi:hypothetical protein
MRCMMLRCHTIIARLFCSLFSYTDIGDDSLAAIVQAGPATKEYSKVVAWIVKQLSAELNLQNVVTEMPDDDDSLKEAFLIELSEFLRDFGGC